MTKLDVLNTKITLDNPEKVTMPQFGLGTYLMKDKDETYKAVTCALQAGYRHIDTAEYYGNETEIGQAVTDFLKSNPSVLRSDIFLTSKIWNTNHPYELAKKSIEGILMRLQVDYLDLCLIHWPTSKRDECWKALEEAYEAKKIRAIGVSNFNVHHLKPFLKAHKIKPVVNQIETHPGFNQADILKFCNKKNIVITSWRTMVNGHAEEIRLLQDIAEKYQTTPTHVALKWAWQQGQIIIPKSVTPSRIISNPDIGEFTLNDSEMKAINKLPQKRLGPDPDDKALWKYDFD